MFTHVSDPREVSSARCEATDTLREWGLEDDDLLETVRLIVSELAANAVRHAACMSPTFDVVLSLHDRGVVVEVRDRHPRRPQPMPLPHSRGQGGYGLRLVADLAAARSGSSQVVPMADGGKSVRVHLTLPTA
ncbi:ATP-binding protein [Streptacidiphilus fuscans]|uniref:ATP-binding protein n=1 Tax=Streptacidiphilus fuscans TaxID=2789292 RepID=A0A931BES1_9ACTN|nr:ATP-binding protein [Streptacidiphilus fuscans]MBF9072833.1 ATP-binding protein [Streptacidiphilus fuscans]